MTVRVTQRGRQRVVRCLLTVVAAIGSCNLGAGAPLHDKKLWLFGQTSPGPFSGSYFSKRHATRPEPPYPSKPSRSTGSGHKAPFSSGLNLAHFLVPLAQRP